MYHDCLRLNYVVFLLSPVVLCAQQIGRSLRSVFGLLYLARPPPHDQSAVSELMFEFDVLTQLNPPGTV